MAQIGLSMITVGKELYANCAKTLMQLSKIGIKGLEWKTFFGNDAKHLRKLLDYYGLVSVSTHERCRDLRDSEKLKEIIEFQQILGTKYITYTLGAVSLESEINQVIKDLNNAGKVIYENGMQLLYHNHAREYEKIGDQFIMDYILDNTDIRYGNLELDVLYLNGVHGVPVKDYMEKRKDRIKIVHLKDGYINTTRTEKQDDFMFAIPLSIGEGIVDIQGTVDYVKKSDFEWLMLENEEPMPDGISEVQRNYDSLFNKFGF